jgi:hypothetical protein
MLRRKERRSKKHSHRNTGIKWEKERAIGKINQLVSIGKPPTQSGSGTRDFRCRRKSQVATSPVGSPAKTCHSHLSLPITKLHRRQQHSPQTSPDHIQYITHPPQPCRNNRPATTPASRSPTKTPSRTRTAASSTCAVTAMPKSRSSAATPSVARSAVTVSCTSSAQTGMSLSDYTALLPPSDFHPSMIQFEAR